MDNGGIVLILPATPGTETFPLDALMGNDIPLDGAGGHGDLDTGQATGVSASGTGKMGVTLVF
jgi:hypothetical protein